MGGESSNKWTVLIEAARKAGYQVTDTSERVELKRDGQTSIFSRAETGRITGYMQACIFLSRQGIKPRRD